MMPRMPPPSIANTRIDFSPPVFAFVLDCLAMRAPLLPE